MTRHVVVRAIERAEAETIRGLGDAGVATVHEAAGQTGLFDAGMRPIQDGARIAGSAVTVSCAPGDNIMIHAAVEVIEPGDVLVVGTTAPSTHGMFGELLATSAMRRGCRGLVIDAGVRDVADLRRMGFPVWSRAIHAEGAAKATPGSVNLPVVCAGVAVNPGDVVVADDDGVAIVLREQAEEVLTASRRRLEREEETRARLETGELGLDVYDYRERLGEMGVRWVDTLGDELPPMRVAILGLGEAGSLFAADLARYGDEVHGYDPSQVPTPPGLRRHPRAESAVTGCDLVLAVTPGSGAGTALSGVVDALEEHTIYADLSTASPAVKGELATMAAGRDLLFADVALMSAVPGRGLGAPALVSGTGARQFADLVNARGGSVEVVGARAGEAAARKLLRSVVMKGIAALLIESMEAAEAHGESGWAWTHLVDQLTSIDVALMERLLFDTVSHAERRLEEMTAAQEMLIGLGVPADMTTATVARLRRLVDEGMPGISFT